jgi:8-oxo-dGTP pyrophosphatase MutT (NUDIX family)
MGRRSRKASFIPDMFVFPGGRAEADDDLLETVAPLSAAEASRMTASGAANAKMAKRLATAAIRETWEETGYVLGNSAVAGETIQPDHAALRFAARAITPTDSPIRFHARFFLADGSALTGDPAGSGELSDLAWFPLLEAQKLPVIDVTEFMLGQLATLHVDSSRIPLFAYRNGRPAIRWYGIA